MKYTHEGMVDQMIANPTVSVEDLALMFGVTPAWVYRIRSSDAFKEYLRARHTELVDPTITAHIDERFDLLVNRSLEVLMDKLSKPSEEVDPEIALRAATLGAKARGFGGFGAKVAPPPPARDPQWLERSADRLRALSSSSGVIVDVQATEIPQQPSAC
jgi:hypothetical protein